MLLMVSTMNNYKPYLVFKLSVECSCQLRHGLPFSTLKISAECTSCYHSCRVVYLQSSIDAASV